MGIPCPNNHVQIARSTGADGHPCASAAGCAAGNNAGPFYYLILYLYPYVGSNYAYWNFPGNAENTRVQMAISNDANNDDSSSNATRNAWNNDGSNAAAGTTCSACLLVLRILVLIVMLLVLGLLVLLGMSKCSSNGDARNDDRSNDDYAGSTDGRENPVYE